MFLVWGVQFIVSSWIGDISFPSNSRISEVLECEFMLWGRDPFLALTLSGSSTNSDL